MSERDMSAGRMVRPEYAATEEGIMRQAEVVAMHSLSDQLKMLNSNMEGFRGEMRELSVDMKDVRERLIAVESAKLEARLEREIARIETELRDASDERRRIEDECVTNNKNAHDRITILATSMSRFQGVVAPLGAVALVVLTYIINHFLKVP